jgi:hypothetical protein
VKGRAGGIVGGGSWQEGALAPTPRSAAQAAANTSSSACAASVTVRRATVARPQGWPATPKRAQQWRTAERNPSEAKLGAEARGVRGAGHGCPRGPRPAPCVFLRRGGAERAEGVGGDNGESARDGRSERMHVRPVRSGTQHTESHNNVTTQRKTGGRVTCGDACSLAAQRRRARSGRVGTGGSRRRRHRRSSATGAESSTCEPAPRGLGAMPCRAMPCRALAAACSVFDGARPSAPTETAFRDTPRRPCVPSPGADVGRVSPAQMWRG